MAIQAIQIQVGKSYSVTDSITDEKTLKNDLMPVRNLLQSDLNSVKTTVQASHDAVRQAASALAEITKVEGAE